MIGSEKTGIAELETHGVNGGLLDSSDANSAGAFAASLLQDRLRRSNFAERWIKKVAKKFSENLVGSRYLELYSSILGAPEAAE